MAGIGFELRRILNRDTYVATLQAYLYAGLISSGPWVLSILSVLLIGILSVSVVAPTLLVTQFLVSVTYLMSASLIFTGGLQLMFTRFISDRLFEERDDIILPNLIGILLLITALAGLLGTLFIFLMFDESLLYRILMVANFVTLTDLW
ncbi:MAG: exopolysaccharide Pel transporter PelG, partial [Pseudomonadales bacterium]